jgi:hypothetical protein
MIIISEFFEESIRMIGLQKLTILKQQLIDVIEIFLFCLAFDKGHKIAAIQYFIHISRYFSFRCI